MISNHLKILIIIKLKFKKYWEGRIKEENLFKEIELRTCLIIISKVMVQAFKNLKHKIKANLQNHSETALYHKNKMIAIKKMKVKILIQSKSYQA